MLDELGVSRLLDVGSGAGKFSVVAAACAPRITFVGIEHRPHLVAAARALAESVGVGNVTFEQGDVTARSWAPFDGVYVFNSFSENGLSPLVQIDQTVELSAVHRLDEVMRVERCLAMRDEGAILLTYHGLGGPIPSSYECVREERVGTDRLRAWRKGNTTPNGEYWFEDGTKVWRATIDEIVLRMGGVLPLPRGAGAS